MIGSSPFGPFPFGATQGGQAAPCGQFVGEFIVGEAVVAPPCAHLLKARLTLKGKPFQVNVYSNLTQINQIKARLTLRGKSFQVNVSSTVTIASPPRLLLNGKELRTVDPSKMIVGKPRLVLRGKAFTINLSQIVQPGKAKLILRGGEIRKVGKAGLIPTQCVVAVLSPSACQGMNLVPSPAYTEVLVPSKVEQV